jgi:hypothetical protein
MAIGDIAEIKLFSSGPSEEMLLNVLHYQQISGVGTVDLITADGVCGIFALNWDVTRLSTMTSNCKARDVKMRLLTGPAAGIEGIDSTINGTAGGSAGTAGSLERCCVMSLRTGYAGRKYRGRIYIPSPCKEAFNSEGTYQSGNPANASILGWGTQALVVLDTTTAGTDAQWQLVIFHRATVSTTLVVHAQLTTLVGIQRRRRIGIGA